MCVVCRAQGAFEEQEGAWLGSRERERGGLWLDLHFLLKHSSVLQLSLCDCS